LGCVVLPTRAQLSRSLAAEAGVPSSLNMTTCMHLSFYLYVLYIYIKIHIYMHISTHKCKIHMVRKRAMCSPCTFHRSLPILPTVQERSCRSRMRFLEREEQPYCTVRFQEGIRASPFLLFPPTSLDQVPARFFFLACREEREGRKKFEVLHHYRAGNKWCSPGKSFVSGNAASCELGCFSAFQEVVVQALLITKSLGGRDECCAPLLVPPSGWAGARP